MRSFGDVGMPRMYTFDSAVLRAHIYLYRLYLAMKNLTCIKWWFFLTVLNQVDTLKYDYISHYFLSRYTHTSVLTSMIMMVQFSCYGLNKLVPFYIKLQREGVGTPLAKNCSIIIRKYIFLCQIDFFFYSKNAKMKVCIYNIRKSVATLANDFINRL